jgi:hypothetical protein
MFTDAPPAAAPARKAPPPRSMDARRPRPAVTGEARKVVSSPATYSEEVKAVRSWLSNLQ